MKSITIGIPTVNGPNRINNCLESIFKWNDVPSIASSHGTLKHDYKVDLMMLDDGSKPTNVESMVWLSKFYNIPVLIHKENMGISKSWNDLANQGNSDIIVLLNDDILVSKNWLTSMCYFLENNDNAGGVGWSFYFITEMDIPTILEADKPLMIDRDPFTKELKHEIMTIDEAIEQRLFQFAGQPGKVMCATGCSFALCRDKYLLTNGFDERMKSFHEETLTGDRIVLIKNKKTRLLELVTLEDLFDRYPNDGYKALPDDIETLSGVLERNTELALDFCLTDKEKAGDTQDRLARKNKKIENGCYINKGIWDNVEAIYKKQPQNEVVRVNSKMGETKCTICHSLIMRKGDMLIEVTPKELNPDKDELAKIDVFPNMSEVEIDSIDLSDIMDMHENVCFDSNSLFNDDRIWWINNRRHTIKYTLPKLFPITSSFIKLLAMYLTEGSITYSGNGSSMTVCCGNDIDFIKEAKELFTEVFDIDIVINTNKKQSYDDVFNVVTHQKIIISLFESLCGRYSAKKIFPSFILNVSDELKQLFLEYLIKGDGFKYQNNDKYHSKQYYADKYGYTENYLNEYFLYTSKSQHLISGLSVLCLSLRIRFTVNYRESVDAYNLRNNTKYYSTKKLIKISEIESPEYVYDISTKKTNMFVDTLGNLLVHNSAMFSELSSLGYPSFMLSEYPLYHIWSATFRANPHLEAEKRMIESRKIYCEKFNVPQEYADNPFKYTDPLIMNKLTPTLIKWLDRDFNEQEVIL